MVTFCLTTNEILDLLKSISIIVASGVAIYGINSWRREAKWKRKYELSEEVLSLFYQTEESIARIRNPFSSLNEGKSREKSKYERTEDSEILDRAYVIYERYEKEAHLFTDIKKLKHRFKAVFGKESIEAFLDLEGIMNDIFKATRLLSMVYWPRQGKSMSDEQFNKHLKAMYDHEAIFWSGLKTPDPIEERIKTTILKIEKVCKDNVKK